MGVINSVQDNSTEDARGATEEVYTATDSTVWKSSWAFGIDDLMLSLLRYFAIRRSPGEFVWEDGCSNDPVVGSAEIKQPFFVVIHQSTPMCSGV